MPQRLRLSTSIPLRNTAVTAAVPWDGGAEPRGWRCADGAGNVLPAQVTPLSADEALVGVSVAELAAGAELECALEPEADAPGAGRGIEVLNQPENGRAVVRYSGLLQTIYRYGGEQFKPHFYPIAAACGYPGGFDDPKTVYPKSITDDAPPDHIWHRSLWYACGELSDVDFYLENGGEGRIEHVAFSNVFSGPLFGGFRERLRWVAPDGRVLLDDERSFVHYRVKGQYRIFDIEAGFTARDEPATFGQTNENALPLIRVADAIDEWDGGRLTLADGTMGGADCFGKRAPWADCSGPLVRKPGLEPEWHGIAMLDHPSNRNHPNAWFARSYGPLGTNLPFFDGPLTLQPGETWRLRHRIVVHAGDPWQAGIPERYDEYANPPAISIE